MPPPAPTDQPKGSSNRTLWIILGSIGLVGACSLLCIGIGLFTVLNALGEPINSAFTEIEDGLNNEGSQFELPSGEAADVSAAIPIGTAQRVGDLEISVTDARVINGEDGVEPEEYYQFLAVDLRIKNVGTQSVSLEEIGPWSWVQDEYDYTYNCCVFSLSNAAILSDELAAGAELEGTIVYEVADDSESFFWVYEGDTSGELIVVELENRGAETDVAVAPVGFRAAIKHTARTTAQ
ncbi:MAG TPA: DUF4352 domain-containing protein [Herpetosiphonaceae bacterium]